MRSTGNLNAGQNRIIYFFIIHKASYFVNEKAIFNKIRKELHKIHQIFQISY